MCDSFKYIVIKFYLKQNKGDKMAVIGFHFTKMLAEKKKSPTGKISVNNSVVLSSVKEAKVSLGGSKQKGIEFNFNYKTAYEPEVANIQLDGAIVFLGPDAKIKETLTKWEKDKKLPEDVLQEVYNHLLEKCSVEVLILARDMQLPPHVPLPKVKR